MLPDGLDQCESMKYGLQCWQQSSLTNFIDLQTNILIFAHQLAFKHHTWWTCFSIKYSWNWRWSRPSSNPALKYFTWAGRCCCCRGRSWRCSSPSPSRSTGSTCSSARTCRRSSGWLEIVIVNEKPARKKKNNNTFLIYANPDYACIDSCHGLL